MPQAKIALTIPRLGLYGGAEGFGWRLAEALAAQGHAVDFLCARAECVTPPAGVRALTLGRPALGRALKNLWFAHAVEDHLEHGHYDLVIGLGRTWSQDILRVGGGPQSIFNTLTEAAHGEGLARLFKRLRRALSPSSAVISWLEARQFERPANPAQRIVCVSNLVRDWLLEVHPAIDPANVSVVYNQPDFTRFSPLQADDRDRRRAELGLSSDDVLICTAGTNFALKGVGTLIRALALLPKNFHLAIAGNRRPGHWRALAQVNGVSNRVRFAGRVGDMPGFYGTADVFALPTYYDACSNAVLEAMACGLPSISSARNGSAVFVPPQRVLADPGDHKTLARMLREAAKHTETERTAAQTKAFNWPKDLPCGIQPYLDMVRDMLAAKGIHTEPHPAKEDHP